MFTLRRTWITQEIKIAVWVVRRMLQGSKETRDTKALAINVLYKYKY